MSKKKKAEVELFPLPQKLLELDEGDEGKGIFYFHEIEDYLYGVLAGKNSHKTIHYMLKTYIMKPCFEARQDGRDMIVKEDQAVEFPRNLKLRRRIEDHYDEILGKPIRVVYLGKRGRYKKYYVSLVEGVWTPKEKQINGKSHKKRASRKSTTTKRKRKPGRRSA